MALAATAISTATVPTASTATTAAVYSSAFPLPRQGRYDAERVGQYW
jgi:hypothetical protein